MTIPEIFDNFNKLKVLIIGDVMLDAYTWGKVERISPEAPVPVVNVRSREIRLGGAGNVVMNVQSLGAEPIICSVIGSDSYGDSLLNLLKEQNLSTEGIIQSETRITTVKERIIAGSQQIVRVDTETDKLINDNECQILSDKIKDLASSASVIIFEDYDKGVLSKELIYEIITFANDNNIPTIVDPKKRNFLFYQHATLFKPNLKELKEGLSISFDVKNPDELADAVSILKKTLELKGVFVTLSEQGVYIDFNGQKKAIPAHIRTISDVSGAGDTVISIAACCLALGLSPELIAGLSNLGGGLVCESVGVVPIDKELLKKEALLSL
ncbi:bifunctional ADP-heptose synthase [Arcicella sp. LKC2W]|uniref:bifunctional heptose 7-phosphate kinase/heptose 1-phosphate adenyltransferase n=1 Tax=Arcicella sp. LKC2W TaxID=2984198 RepID=UPI002B1F16C7|nr:bifunctional ADP-heptose synthase [Arcicella sp. LKC2W]MEA5457961.1 bifunctional ADP-heptose synthase [Arcicella sp. LKC2W]